MAKMREPEQPKEIPTPYIPPLRTFRVIFYNGMRPDQTVTAHVVSLQDRSTVMFSDYNYYKAVDQLVPQVHRILMDVADVEEVSSVGEAKIDSIQ